MTLTWDRKCIRDDKINIFSSGMCQHVHTKNFQNGNRNLAINTPWIFLTHYKNFTVVRNANFVFNGCIRIKWWFEDLYSRYIDRQTHKINSAIDLLISTFQKRNFRLTLTLYRKRFQHETTGKLFTFCHYERRLFTYYGLLMYKATSMWSRTPLPIYPA